MTIMRKEIRRGLLPFGIWTGATAFLVAVCVFLFPEMKEEMDSVSDMFANMGNFSAAFGMDRLSMGDLIGFYGIECGNILGIGGGFFAAFLGISILSKEEKERTAEFLLSHPVSRFTVVAQKLLAVLIQVLAFNGVVAGCGLLSSLAIGEGLLGKGFWLLHLSFTLLQAELACICFGISAFLRRGGLGLGLGIAALFYCLNLLRNLSKSAEFLKYATPYAYTEAAEIVTKQKLAPELVGLGLCVGVLFAAIGFFVYTKKDIAA